MQVGCSSPFQVIQAFNGQITRSVMQHHTNGHPPEVEHMTSKLQIQCPNHYAIKPLYLNHPSE